MALPAIDELMSMDDTQLADLFAREFRELLDSVSPERRERLERLQWKIEIRLNNQPNQIAKMVEIQKMMYEALGELRDALNGQVKESEEADVVSLGDRK